MSEQKRFGFLGGLFTAVTALMTVFIVTSAISTSAHASVSLLDKDDWKVNMSGFIETDFINDSTRSLTEVIGNNPIDRSPSFNADNGRLQFSTRNSRLAFTVLPPAQDDWKSKGYFEFDLLGYDPGPNATATGAANSEAGFFTNPTLRVRHAYLSMEKNGWQFLAGQTWTLFGWQANYILSTVSVAPGPATVYQRTPQLMVSKTMGEDVKIQVAASAARPTQRDSDMPNVDVAVRMIVPSYASGFAVATGEAAAQPLSIGLSSTFKQFSIANGSASSAGQSHPSGSGYAVDALIPILAAKDKDFGNTLTLTGEYTVGTGDGDAFPGWTGNVAQTPQTASAIYTQGTNGTNLDPGLGGFDAFGDVFLVQLQTWNAQLQYHFAQSTHMFATIGYGQLSATNISGFETSKVNYDHEYIQFLNFYYDMTKQIRLATEYSKITTHYIDDVGASDQRYQVSAWFRF